MKEINFSRALDFPLEQKTFRNMQLAYQEIIKTLIGHFDLQNVGNFIICGCEATNGVISSGMMYIDGHLCSFEQANGTDATKIKKIETIENASYFGGNNLPTYYDYTAMVNTNGTALSSFTRLPKLEELINQTIDWADVANKPQVVVDPYDANATPTQLTVLQRLELLEKKNAVFVAGGGMVFWNKPHNEIPFGWHEVVNWKGRIPVGVDDTLNAVGQLQNPEFATLVAGQMVPGRTGGEKTKSIEQANIPNYNLSRSVGVETVQPGNVQIRSNTSGNMFTETINSGGGNQPIDILNPYRTVLFIEWTGL